MKLSPASLLDLLHLARSAATTAERRFVLLNRTRDLVPYHAAVLWHPHQGLVAHSAVSQIDPLGPYGQWLGRLARSRAGQPAGALGPTQVEPALAAVWNEWWPPHALWLPAGPEGMGLLLCRETSWSEAEEAWLSEWALLWSLTEQAAAGTAPRRVLDLGALWQSLKGGTGARSLRRSRRLWFSLAALLGVMLIPVQLTVRAPGELVPREPTVLRATLDGMARKLLVEPNQRVEAGQLLAELDDAAAASRLEVARQALVTAEAEWRQTSQQALTDPRAKAMMAVALGKMEEKRTEVDYLGEQVSRTQLRAPHDGVVLVDDPGNWAGRTVAAGEPLLRLAKPDDQEIEAWLSVGDAVDLPLGSAMRLHLASRPASPVHAQMRLYAFEAVPRPEGGLAYRLRGQLLEAPRERLGARGTVHVDGPRVPLVYWMLRRPLAAIREATGW